MDSITGTAAGVPFLALPPAGGARGDAPLVLAWHLLDAPRTEAAFAAALPLDGLDAWRVYFGLPLSGSRLPEGGGEEVMRRAYEDVVLNVYGPVVGGAVEELGPALEELRGQLALEPGPVALVGGSIGAAVALSVAAAGELDVRAMVLVSPVVSLRRTVEAGERQFGIVYDWSEEANAVADRVDFVARAGELGRPAVLAAVGAEDDVAFREAAAELVAALADDRAELVVVPGMGHALAEEPGVEPAPQTAHAEEVNRRAVEWLRHHLGA
jgi:pimeloyl-ACP methyl ester carboxylesterase